jgi:hypothetical protein
MRVKILQPRGTTIHVWDRKKYYPGTEHELPEDLAKIFLRRKMAVEVKRPDPPKRKPGRPRKIFGS